MLIDGLIEGILDLYPWMSDLNFIKTQALTGLSSGMYILLVAAGLTLTFGICRIVNFSHGAVYMLGAYLMASFSQYANNLFLFLALVLIVAMITGVISAVIELGVLRKIYKRGFESQIIATLGVGLVISSLLHLVYGSDFKRGVKPEIFDRQIEFGEYPFPMYNLFIIFLVPLLLLGLYVFFKYSKTGVAIRAVSTDRVMAEALGNNVNRVMTFVFFLSGAMAGLAGGLAAPMFSVSLSMGLDSLLNCLAVIIIGGLGSIMGSLVGAVLVGLTQAFGVLFAPSFYSLFIYLFVLLVLIVRPRGLFGKAEGRAEEEGVGQ